MTDYPCGLCGQMRTVWHDPKVKEPPKDRPFLIKWNDYHFTIGDYSKSYGFMSGDHPCKNFNEIEKWCEIPEGV